MPWCSRLGREPTIGELSANVAWKESEVEHVKRLSGVPVSLDHPVGDAPGSELGDVIADERAEGSYEQIADEHWCADVRRAIERLPERDRRVLNLRFGFSGEDPLTLERVGDEIGVTRERARQIESRALEALGRSSAIVRLRDASLTTA